MPPTIPVSTASGPISTKRVAPWAVRARTPSRKRTASRTCRTQYSAVNSVMGSPVSVDTIGICGAANDSVSTTRAKSSSIGSINGEWNACETLNRLVRSKRSAIASTSASTPEITTERGPLTAAIPTPDVNKGTISASEAATATIAPPPGSSCINRPRAATSAHASSSESTPATCAAAISPIECPATASGRTPHDSSNRNSATSSANNPAWAYIV